MEQVSDNLINKLHRDAKYYDERLQLLFHVIYKKPALAYENWQRYYHKHGFEKTIRKLNDKPKFFGSINGKLSFGFIKNSARKDAEISVKEVYGYAKKLHIIVLQIKQAEKIANTRKANSQQQNHLNEVQKLRANDSKKNRCRNFQQK
jgi:hypothetical protein